MKIKKQLLLQIVLFVFVAAISGCAILKTIENIKRLKFRIGTINNFKICGIDIKGKQKIEDFSAKEAFNLVQAFGHKNMPLKFTLTVEAENPNDGRGGYPRTDINLKSFKWILLVEERETISGNIQNPVYVPGVGESTLIPIDMEIDLYKFFGAQGYKGAVDLALRLAGMQGKPVEVKLIARPVIGTPLGDISYPDEITIIQKEFR